MLKTIFYNAQEHRPRALWRIVLHFAFIIAAALALVLPFTMLAVGSASEPPPPEAFESGALLYGAVIISAAVPLVVISASLWVFGRYIDRRPFSDYGLWVGQGAWWRDLGFGMALGAVLMAGVFAVQLALGWITITGTFVSINAPFGLAILLPLFTFVSVGIYEEMLSRGYHLLNIAEGFHAGRISASAAVVIAWVLSSAVFGVLHALNPNASAVSTFNLVLAGLFLGLGFVLTRSLAIPIGLHITWNFFQGNVFGLPVSGMGTGTTFIGIEQGGPAVWTGGAFGPEAGLIGLLAILLGVLLTVGYVRWAYGEVRLQTQLATYTPKRQRKEEITPQASGQPVA